MDEDIISLADHQEIQENLFLDELNEIVRMQQVTLKDYLIKLQNYQILLDKLVAEEQVTKKTYYNRYTKERGISFSNANQNAQALFLEITRTLMNLRTAITGESITFLENFDGVQKLIKQEDALKMFTANSTSIVLLKGSIQEFENNNTLIDQYYMETRSILAQLQSLVDVEGNVVEAGRFDWDEDKPDDASENPIKHKHYKKRNRDDDVYAYYTASRLNNHIPILLWRNRQNYNLGQLYEAAMERVEKISQMERTIQERFLARIYGDHPLAAIFEADFGLSAFTLKGRNVPGLTEGDFRTAKGDWIQAKRNNPKIISFTQAAKKMRTMISLLNDIVNNPNNYTKVKKQLKANVATRLAEEYYSDPQLRKQVIEKIRKNLPKINGQSVV